MAVTCLYGWEHWAGSLLPLRKSPHLNLNKKIPKEEKGFLIKQEVADGVVNCGMYLGFTKLVQICVNWGLEKGKITSDTIKPIVEKAAKDKKIDLAKTFFKQQYFRIAKRPKREFSKI